MKRNLIKISLLLFLILPFSCDLFTDECGGFKTTYTTIDSLSIRIEETNITADSVQKKIYIQVENEIYTIQNSDQFRLGFSTASNAFACSPPDPIPTQKLESLNITSSDTIQIGNKVFAPNESINELFYIDFYEKVSIEKYIESYDVSISQNSNPLTLGIINNIEFNSELTFTITLNDNAQFILKTNEL